ncbi:MAG: hypothetical protein ACE5JP_02200 [Candidatus Bipolaricaulia bacterium]
MNSKRVKRKITVVVAILLVGVVLAGCARRPVVDRTRDRETRRFWEFTGLAPGDETTYPGDSPALRQIKSCEVAKVEAYAKTAEEIAGFQIEGGTTVRNFVLENREVETQLSAFIRGLTPVKTDYNRIDEVCSVTVRVNKRDIERELRRAVITPAPFAEEEEI